MEPPKHDADNIADTIADKAPLIASPIRNNIIRPLNENIVPDPIQPPQPAPVEPQAQKEVNPAQTISSLNTEQVYPDPIDFTPRPAMTQVGTSYAPSSVPPIRNERLIGLYVMGSIVILSGIYSLIALGSVTYLSIFAILSILLGVGLLFRIRIARKIMIILAVISIVLEVVAVVSVYGYEMHMRQANETSVSELQTLAQNNMSQSYKNTISVGIVKLNTQEQQAEHSLNTVYVPDIIQIVVYTCVVIYLLRPKVKRSF